MKKSLLAVMTAVMVAVSVPYDAQAISLKVQPLLYNETLKKDEKKKGFIDIQNPLGQKIILQTSVQAFRQTDDNGSLEFYSDKRISAGLIPDLDEIELGPREAVRMYFLLDGTKLPEGDVFAALFVSTKAEQESQGVAESVRLGTLFTLVNGTGGPREASIERLDSPLIQLGSSVHGSYTVKNTADPKSNTGFYPRVSLSLTPFGGAVEQDSPLVMAGRSRQVAFTLPDHRFGVYQLKATYGESTQSRWVLVATGVWSWLAPLIVLVLGVTVAVILNKRSRTKYFRVR